MIMKDHLHGYQTVPTLTTVIGTKENLTTLGGTNIVLFFARLDPFNGMTAIAMVVTETPLYARNSKHSLII